MNRIGASVVANLMWAN